MVIEAGVAVGYMVAWAVRKGRRVAGGVDGEVDEVIDAGLEKLHSAVAAKLDRHPALEDLAEEVESAGQVSELTRQQVELAVTAAARKDEEFGQTVTDLIGRLRAAEQERGISVVAGAGSRVFTGDVHAEARDGGVAFGQVAGDVHVDRGVAGGERPDPSEPSRSRP
ncbi:hypothetical protein KDL01_12940 [Actinospica durhamensis]|uniref:Chromosome partitioning protein n=1 Tax=Actinospica durhamensis TaxID=1508375 RepID=A0A941ES94_9ACTN|nr:hypothetical protein [Actinospica durhamensis]MBR7834174.1 hypothetical protein [Actinospica durhamensis]